MAVPAAANGEDDLAVLKKRTDAEMVALAWRTNTTSTIMVPGILATILLVLHGRVPHTDLWIWAGVMTAILIVRFTLLYRWKFHRPGLDQYVRWRWIYFFAMLVSMATYGSLAPLFLARLDPAGQAFVICLIVGLIGAAVSQLAMSKLAVFVIHSVTMVEMIGTCLWIGGEVMLGFFALGAAYWVYLIKVSLEHHKTQKEAVWLRFERAALADNLRIARDAAELANEAKSTFLANVSHELRTPLNAILGFSEMIKLGILGHEPAVRQTQYAGFIHDSGRHLLDLINDLLDLSKAEAGRLTLHEEEVDLGAVVEDCIRLLSPAADQAGVTIAARHDDFEGATLRADDRKLRQILLNLLSNAMKFTPQGGRVTLAADNAPDGGLTLSVVDTGAGMTADELEQAMLPFVQVGDAHNRQVPGTGLGLPLTKQLVELHGGRLEMDSAPGRGTTATVHVPKERVASGVGPARTNAADARRGASVRA
ncbi:MAG: HAMP domain-containing histidine kinase [Rhodospirillaceae bacterium]|nr:HAMP domain-containing histidine kinase [Rhodospirillaceae bacterium]